MGTSKGPKAYDEAFKRTAIDLVINAGMSVAAAARQVGVYPETLTNWIAQAGLQQQSARPEKSLEERNKELERENRILRMERDILKEAVGIFSQRPK